MSMLKKSERLSRSEFSSVFSSGKRFHSTVATLIYLQTHDFHGAVVVSKKVSKIAATRNQLRRLIYSMLYQKRHEGGTFIVLLKPEARSLSRVLLRQLIADLIERTNKSA